MTFEEAGKNPKEEEFGLKKINIRSLCKTCRHSKVCWFSNYDPENDTTYFEEGLIIDCNFFEEKGNK